MKDQTHDASTSDDFQTYETSGACLFGGLYHELFAQQGVRGRRHLKKTGMAQKFMTIGKGANRTAYLHINLEGIALPDSQDRAPVNVAIVIDKSGSMSGRKLRQAKRAAIMALGLLNRQDTISIVTYSSGVNVLVPAMRLRDRAMIERRIDNIYSGGSTALYDGVRVGGEQLEKYLDREHVNRVILLSDGLANVGPKSPSQLAKLWL